MITREAATPTQRLVTPVWFAATMRTRLLAASLILVTGSCNNKCTGERDEPERPEIDHVEVSPPAMSAPLGVDFAVSVRLRDEHGSVLPFDPEASVRWTLDPHLTKLDAEGSRIFLRGLIPADAPTSPPIAAKVKVEVNGQTAEGVITLIAAGGAEGADWIEAGHVAKSPPAIVVVDGVSGGSPRNDSILAFVSESPLGDYRHTPAGGRVALFSTDHEVGYVGVVWTDGQDRVVLASPALTALGVPPAPPPLTNDALDPPLAVPVSVWIAATGDAVPGSVRADIDYAYRVLRETKSGLTLDTTIMAVLPSGVTLNVSGPDWTCPPDVVTQMADAGIPDGALTPLRVNVIYVTDILNHPAWRGYACPADATHGIIVFVSLADRVRSTFAHELGHAFSQWGKEFFGHYRQLGGTDPANLMWPGESDSSPTPRERLSLGQLFQLSADARAVVNVTGKRTGKVETCQADPATADPCPPLTKELP